MSTVFGIRRFDGEPIDRAYLEQCVEVSAEAGPDRRDNWLSPRDAGDVALGHGLLATTDDAARERQPARLGDVWLSADARIDNRPELVAALAAHGERVPDDATDDRVILHAYRAWGLDALPRLVGDFAFVLWDARRRALFAARDCIGVRPLFYAADRRRAIVASEIRQLFVDATVSRELDPDVVADYLHAAHRSDSGSSFYRAVRQVRPGHVLCVTGEGVDEQRFWSWREPPPLRYATRDQYAEHLAEVFGAAVAARTRAHGPVGLLLSGGLDSSAIAGFAPNPRSLRAYSMVFDEHVDCDERAYIEPLTEALGIERHWLRPERCALYADSPLVDEPDASTWAEPHWSEALRDLSAAGGRVMLGGDGGETVLLGESNAHFIDWLLGGDARELVREVRGHVDTWGEWPRVPWRGALASRLPSWAYRRIPAVLSQGGPSWLDPSRAAWKRRLRRHRARRGPRTFRSYAHQVAFDAIVSDAGTGAGWWVPSAHHANRYGVVYAFPFMDRRLLELLFAVPVEQFFDRGVDRSILRRALAGRIPDPVRLRTDPTNFDSWFGHVASCRAWRAVIEATPWPDLPAVPAREAALSSRDRAWRRIALAQLVLWYDRQRPRSL